MKTIIVLLTVTIMTFCLNVNAQTSSGFVVYKHYNHNFALDTNREVKDNITFIVNGPLCDDLGTPTGGYVENGVQQKDWVHPEVIVKSTGRLWNNFSGKNPIYGKSDNAIFGITKNGKMILVPYYQWNDAIELEWGFQNGRMLVLNGYNIHNRSSNSKYVRSGIGYKDDGTIVVIISNGNVSFWELSQKFIGEGCNNAIYLDGILDYAGYATKEKIVGLKVGQSLKINFFSDGLSPIKINQIKINQMNTNIYYL